MLNILREAKTKMAKISRFIVKIFHERKKKKKISKIMIIIRFFFLFFFSLPEAISEDFALNENGIWTVKFLASREFEL